MNHTSGTDKKIQSIRPIDELQMYFRAIADNSFDWQILTDSTGKVLYSNKAIEKFTGYSATDYINGEITVRDLIHPDDREISRSQIQKIPDQPEREREVTCRLVSKAGETRYVHIHSQPIQINGNIAGFQTCVRDITDTQLLKSLQPEHEKFTESEKRLRQVIRNSPVILFTQDRELRYNWFYNPHEEFDPHHIIGKTDFDLVPEEDAIRISEIKRKVLATGQAAREEIKTTINNRDFYYDLSVEAVRDSTGQISGVSCISFDITNFKQDKEKLRQSEERYRLAAASGQIAVWKMDLTTGQMETDGSLENLVGYQQGEIGNTLTWADVTHPEDLNWLNNHWQSIIENNAERYDVEHRMIHRNGSLRWVEVRAKAIKNSNGRVTGIIGTSRDITERKQEEEAKSNFISILAHELRNPLASILARSELLHTVNRRTDSHDKTPNPVYAESVSIIKRQSEIMQQLLNDLLDVSRIALGKIVLKRKLVELREAVLHSIETIQSAKDCSSKTIDWSGVPAGITVEADPVRLEQILTNLVGNAVKFTGQDGQISISAREDDQQAIISVKDNGIGIRPEEISTVFQLFYQEDKDASIGLGIGLKITKDLVELHGGTIEARSRGKDLGSEFIVSLPLRASADPAIRKQYKAVDENGASTKRILVVDDNKDLANTMVEALTLMHYQAKAAYGGLEALSIIPAYKPDIVFMDISMPDLNGYEAARRIIAEKEMTGLRFTLIALSGYGQESDIVKGRKAGFDGHLLKPVGLKTLRETIESIS